MGNGTARQTAAQPVTLTQTIAFRQYMESIATAVKEDGWIKVEVDTLVVGGPCKQKGMVRLWGRLVATKTEDGMVMADPGRVALTVNAMDFLAAWANAVEG